MGRIRDTMDDAGMILLLVVGAKLLSSFKLPSLSEIQAENADRFRRNRGGRGAGPGQTYGGGAGNGVVWSEATMQLFAEEMAAVPIDPFVVLLGIARASNFNADEFLGGSTGLLLVQREDLAALGYPAVPTFEELDAPHQIPWIARVIAYRAASSGGAMPTTVEDLAVLLHPANPTITEALRNEARQRAAEMKGHALYLEHEILLRHVMQGSQHPYPPGWGGP
jgi:hypothetical protein